MLHRYEPSAIDRLQRDFPALTPYIAPGKMLGQERSTSPDNNGLIELARQGVLTAQERVAFIRKALEHRHRRARIIRLVANVISGLSAAGLIGAALLDQQFVSLITAAITFAASALALVAEYYDYGGGSSGGLSALISRLGTVFVALSTIEGEIRILPFTSPSSEHWIELVRRANTLAAEVRQIEFEGGVA